MLMSGHLFLSKQEYTKNKITNEIYQEDPFNSPKIIIVIKEIQKLNGIKQIAIISDSKQLTFMSRRFTTKIYVMPKRSIDKMSAKAAIRLAKVWKMKEANPMTITSKERKKQNQSSFVFTDRIKPKATNIKLVKALTGSLQKLKVCLSQ